jgi:PTH1 family peptidyl-tRNA hydrolase
VAQESWLIVGLGNPGSKYEATRHNIGQMVLDELALRVGGKFKSHQTNSRVLEGRVGPGSPKFVLAKPNSFMNLSGGPVASLAKYYGVPPGRVIVIHDEIDLPFDTLKLKQGGGHGGHNGLRDIAKAIDTPDFLRVRVGIGRPPGRQDPADFVLQPFGTVERETLAILIGDAADAVEGLATEGLLATQQRVHGKAGA